MQSITLLFPLPLGPTTELKLLWNGPISLTPPYDLKFSTSNFKIIKRGVLILNVLPDMDEKNKFSGNGKIGTAQEKR